jgi:PASTA domain-containing protein
MRRELTNLNSDDVQGAAALTEITAMARVGGFEIGKQMTRAEITSLKLDASRARRRGKPDRSEELEKRALQYEELLARIEAEQELELVRAPVAKTDEQLVTGRITDKGRPKAGLRVDLVDADRKSVANDKSNKLGSFTLRTANGESGPYRIVVSDGKGGVIHSEAAPMLNPGKPAYVEIDVTGAKPQWPTKPPDDDTSENFAEMPAVTGLPAEDAVAKVKAAGLEAEIQERAVDGAEPGTVGKQAPAPGSRVAKGSKVKLVVAASHGQKVPRLTGRTLRAVPKMLTEDNFKLGNVELVHDPENAGKVIDQAPKEGAPAPLGSAISVRVATGEDKADMRVAAILTVTDARGIDLRLSEQTVAKALQRARVTNLPELREFTKRPAAEIAERFNITGRSRAAAARSLIADVARRFPGS